MVASKPKIVKALSTLMALVLTFMFVLAPIEVNAQTTRAALCSTCNNGEMVRKPDEVGDYNFVTYQPCEHGYKGKTDSVYIRPRTIKYVCNNCGETTWRVIQEYSYICYGLI